MNSAIGMVSAMEKTPHGDSASAFTTMSASTARMMIMMAKTAMSAAIPPPIAYEHSAANSSHSAEIVSPRAMASTPQHTAPTTATSTQTSIERGDMRRPVGGAAELSPVGEVI